MKYYIPLLLILSACGSKETLQSGPAGPKGLDGAPAPACSLTQQKDGVLITCGDNQAFVSDGVDAQSLTIDPFCPTINGGIGFQEQAIRIDGKIYAVYFDGPRAFLTLLKPGNYQTTDGRPCSFTITPDNQITY